GIIFYNPFITDTLYYTQNSSCSSFDTTWTLVNYTCAPVRLTSMIFSDSTHPFFANPKLPITIKSGDSITLPIRVLTPRPGSFKNNLLVNYQVFEHTYTNVFPFSLEVSYPPYEIAPLMYNVPYPCKVLDTILKVKN